MDRIDGAQVTGLRQEFVADVLVDDVRLGRLTVAPADRVTDDLGLWLTYSFRLRSGAVVVLARAHPYMPTPGYVLTTVSAAGHEALLAEFLAEAGLGDEAVSHASFWSVEG
ncbi:hypothetical protein [Streptomyces sp. NPDC049881]|uniref:hypothetical protein n=1 Tax=unclassified Streptomyces TaxID=2593676 RepID=UPI0034491171